MTVFDHETFLRIYNYKKSKLSNLVSIFWQNTIITLKSADFSKRILKLIVTMRHKRTTKIFQRYIYKHDFCLPISRILHRAFFTKQIQVIWFMFSHSQHHIQSMTFNQWHSINDIQSMTFNQLHSIKTFNHSVNDNDDIHTWWVHGATYKVSFCHIT